VLAVGILWGAPVALFIGLVVSIAGVIIGLVYGVVAGYKGKRTDEGLMRINDIFYSLPTLPLLIILSVTIGRSIFLITGFLVIFSWVGMAKISRSLALQLKNLQYVEAAKLMGQSDRNIIFRHIIPQLLPLTFASIAISVPAAILGESTLSFLGLSDASIPTWGQILHDAQKTVIPSRYGADSSVNGIYQDLSTAQLADSISKSGGFGLARNLEKQLSRQILIKDSAPAISTGENSKFKPST